MPLLVGSFSKLYCKLENHRHHPPQLQALSASLHALQSDVSSSISRFVLNSNPGDLGILSLEWIQKCLHLLPFINQAFAKLVVEVDCHMNQLKAESMEAYLNYSLDLLDLLNSISSSLSCLAHARLSLAYALSLVEASPSSAINLIKAIELKRSGCKVFKDMGRKDDWKERPCSAKEEVVLQALTELRRVGLWICSIILAGLTSDANIYLEMKKLSGLSSNPSLINFDSSICEAVMERGCELKEVKELKESASFLAAAISGENNSSDAAEEMQMKLKVFEKMLDGVGKEVNSIFSEVLARRNELLNGLRFRK